MRVDEELSKLTMPRTRGFRGAWNVVSRVEPLAEKEMRVGTDGVAVERWWCCVVVGNEWTPQ